MIRRKGKVRPEKMAAHSARFTRCSSASRFVVTKILVNLGNTGLVLPGETFVSAKGTRCRIS